MSGVETNQADQTPVDSHAEDGETGAVCPKTPSPTDIQERETIARIIDRKGWERFDRYMASLDAVGLPRQTEDNALDPGAWMYVRDSLAKADAILALRSNPQPGSEGWKLVPVEPADEMLSAPDDHGVGLYSREVFKIIYRAMLAASPTPPTAQPGEVERRRSALEFYANNYSWRSSTVYMCGHSGASSAELDRGNKARAALTPSESGEEG